MAILVLVTQYTKVVQSKISTIRLIAIMAFRRCYCMTSVIPDMSSGASIDLFNFNWNLFKTIRSYAITFGKDIHVPRR